MPAVLVDSNILLDIAIPDPVWEIWSSQALAACAEASELVINPLIYAEVAAGYQRREELDYFLPSALYRREDLPWDAAFLAGQSFVLYRRRGGLRRSPLPDFYIGAHAAVCGYRLLTRDPARYRTYFPRLEIVAPE